MTIAVQSKIFQGIGILFMFSSMFSKRSATSLFVRAFNAGSSRRVLTLGSSRFTGSSPSRWLSTQGVAPVGEDLDAALDSLLGTSFDEEEESFEAGVHMKDSHPVPSALVEEVSQFPVFAKPVRRLGWNK